MKFSILFPQMFLAWKNMEQNTQNFPGSPRYDAKHWANNLFRKSILTWNFLLIIELNCFFVSKCFYGLKTLKPILPYYCWIGNHLSYRPSMRIPFAKVQPYHTVSVWLMIIWQEKLPQFLPQYYNRAPWHKIRQSSI